MTSSHLFNPFEDVYLSRRVMVLRAAVSDIDAAALAVHMHRRQPPTARRVGMRAGFLGCKLQYADLRWPKEYESETKNTAS